MKSINMKSIKWKNGIITIDGLTHSKRSSMAVEEGLKFFQDGTEIERVLMWAYQCGYNAGFADSDKNPRQPESMDR